MPYNCSWFQNSFAASTFLFLLAWGTPLLGLVAGPRRTVPGGLQPPCPVWGWDTRAASSRGSVNSAEPTPVPAVSNPPVTRLTGPVWRRLSGDPLVLAMVQPHHTCRDFLTLLAATRLDTPRHPWPFCLRPSSLLSFPVQKPQSGVRRACVRSFVIITTRSSHRPPRSIRPKFLHAWGAQHRLRPLSDSDSSQHNTIFCLLNGSFIQHIYWTSATWRSFER